MKTFFMTASRFPSNPSITRVPFFLIICIIKKPKIKRAKGYYSGTS